MPKTYQDRLMSTGPESEFDQQLWEVILASMMEMVRELKGDHVPAETRALIMERLLSFTFGGCVAAWRDLFPDMPRADISAQLLKCLGDVGRELEPAAPAGGHTLN